MIWARACDQRSCEIPNAPTGVELAAGYEGHTYAVAVPVLGAKGGARWALLGETTKYTSLSTRRFLGVEPVA